MPPLRTLQVPHYRVTASDVLELLRQSVAQNIVRVEGRLYRQARGIPQVSASLALVEVCDTVLSH